MIIELQNIMSGAMQRGADAPQGLVAIRGRLSLLRKISSPTNCFNRATQPVAPVFEHQNKKTTSSGSAL
jgi:hypothetical protein